MNNRMALALAGVVRENKALLTRNAGLLADAEALNDEIDRLREHLGDCADCLDALAGDMPPARATATRSITARSRALLLTGKGSTKPD